VAAPTKTNERPGTRAQHRHARMSATKARAVLDLIRNLPVDQAADVLRFTERGAAETIGKVLASAVANAEHNDELDGESLYVSACYADEGPTLKRWRPRARGRATRIRKRTTHITIIVSPMPAGMAAKVEAQRAAAGPVAAARGRGRAARESRRARVARSRGEAAEATETEEATPATEAEETPVTTDEATTDEATTDEVTAEDVAGGEPDETAVAEAEEAAEADDSTEDSDDAESDAKKDEN
jgi:large subunit ribosomal protein L22